jgi:nucleotide-binding universal stress UspA family protein
MHPLRIVLCATDLSDAGAEAIDQAAAIAAKDGAQLVVLHVVPVPVVLPTPMGEAVPPIVEQSVVVERDGKELDRQLKSRPSATREVIRASRSVPEEILQRAGSLGADLLVVGSHRQSTMERVLIGSTAAEVVRQARCPVLIARPLRGRGKVVVATDLTVASRPARRAAAEEARRRQARLVAVHALELPPAAVGLGGTGAVPAPPDDPRSPSAQRRAAQERLTSFLGKAEVAAEPLVAEGAAPASVIALCEQGGVELIVAGTHSKGRLERVLLGSVAEAIVRKAPCSVLTVPAVKLDAGRQGDLLDE